MDFKSPLVFAGPPVGIALACFGWLVFSSGGPAAKPLNHAEAQLSQLPAAPRSAASLVTASSAAAGADLFGALAAPPTVRLDGISRTRRRTAALLAFGSAPAQWVNLGSTIQGVTLVEVTDARVSLETVLGRENLSLGESTMPPAATSADQTVSGGVGEAG